MRLAMVFRIEDSGTNSSSTNSDSSWADGVAATLPFSKLRRTSSLVILPPGPVPTTIDRSILCSLAMVFANGEAFIALAWASSLTRTVSCGTLGAFSPGLRIKAIVAPTGTSSPTFAIILLKIPDSSASISKVTFSVSISRMLSLFSTLVPSFFSHFTIVPVCIAASSLGNITATAILIPPLVSPHFTFQARGLV